MKSWVTLHLEIDLGRESVRCARCRAWTLLIRLGPDGPTQQVDVLALERTGDSELPVHYDVAPHCCSRRLDETELKEAATKSGGGA
jgi:hypothetical protein